ncbi:MAG: tail fiber domain-containing protein [Bacteroidota bacterium]
MKHLHFFITIVLTPCLLHAQNVGIGISAPGAKLHIKGTADTTQFIIDAYAIQGISKPLIKLRNSSGTDLMWIHSDHVDNTFIGRNAGRVNNAAGGGTHNTFIGATGGNANTTGDNNTATGFGTLYFNTTGHDNSAFGDHSLYYNEGGNANTAIGNYSLDYCTADSNTAVGYGALLFSRGGSNATAVGARAMRRYGYAEVPFKNTNTAVGYEAMRGGSDYLPDQTGNHNAALGYQALANNTNGSYNTAVGTLAMLDNRGGDYNVAIGRRTLENTTGSNYNTALGANAGFVYNNGNYNTFIGYDANSNGDGYINSTAVGRGATVLASNQIRFGNSTVGSIGGYAPWTELSDGRYKKNIAENVIGLDFIMNLRPVTYNLDIVHLANTLGEDNRVDENGRQVAFTADAETIKARSEKSTILYTGFIAQDVEAAAKKIGYNFSGVDVPKNEGDLYGLRYSEFVVPLVKAVQEQQATIKNQQQQIDELKALVNKLVSNKN